MEIQHGPVRPSSSLALVVLVCLGFAFTTKANGQDTSSPEQQQSSATSPAKQEATFTPFPDQPLTGFGRWVDLQALTIGARYRSVQDGTGRWPISHVQTTGGFRVRFKFDGKGRYGVTAGIATGNAFTSGWNNTGIGSGTRVNTISVKQLYLTAIPVGGVELSSGSFGFARGESTEITTYDNDGYLVGERVTIRRPQWLWADELVATYAYVGELTEPSAFRRLDALSRVNYRQVQATRKVARVAAVSAEYTRALGVTVLRAAATVRRPAIRVVDLVRLEGYQRRGGTGARGFAVSAERRVTAQVTTAGGYADIDPGYGGLNADRFPAGRRVFTITTVRLVPDLTASFFAARAVRNAIPVTTRTRVEVVVSWNALPAALRTGLFR